MHNKDLECNIVAPEIELSIRGKDSKRFREMTGSFNLRFFARNFRVQKVVGMTHTWSMSDPPKCRDNAAKGSPAPPKCEGWKKKQQVPVMQ